MKKGTITKVNQVKKGSSESDFYSYHQIDNSSTQVNEPKQLYNGISGQAYTSQAPFATIKSIRSGFNFKHFKHTYDLINLPTSKWAEIIGVSERTMQSILKEKRNLDQNKSEKLAAFLMLIEYATNVLGNHTNMMEWLHYKAPALKGQSPLDYIDTFQGITMLKEHLFKVETGNLA